MSELRTSGLSPEAIRSLDLATVIARNSGHTVLAADHLATALLKQSDGLASRLLRSSFGVDLFELRTRLEHGLRELQTSFTPGALTHRYGGEAFEVAPEVDRIVERARRLAVQQRKPAAGTDHLLAALLEEDSPATRTLENAGIRSQRLQVASADVPLPPDMAARHSASDTSPQAVPVTEPQSVNATPIPQRRPKSDGAVFDLVLAVRDGRIAPVYERSYLLEQVANVLVQPGCSVVLLGETGSGRRSLIPALAQLVSRQPLPGLKQSVIAVSPAALLDGPELIVRQAIDRADGAILALPDLHQFFGAAPLTGFIEAGVALKQALLEGRIRLVGTSTQSLSVRYLESDPALRDHLRTVVVPAASEAETAAILDSLKSALERDNGVRIAAPALKSANSLSRQYLSVPQPGAAVSLLQRACALVRLSGTAMFEPASTTFAAETKNAGVPGTAAPAANTPAARPPPPPPH
jgi:ATP-dependent Clp protease ATP-binding subunit ClpA